MKYSRGLQIDDTSPSPSSHNRSKQSIRLDEHQSHTGEHQPHTEPPPPPGSHWDQCQKPAVPGWLQTISPAWYQLHTVPARRHTQMTEWQGNLLFITVTIILYNTWFAKGLQWHNYRSWTSPNSLSNPLNFGGYAHTNSASNPAKSKPSSSRHTCEQSCEV